MSRTLENTAENATSGSEKPVAGTWICDEGEARGIELYLIPMILTSFQQPPELHRDEMLHPRDAACHQEIRYF